MTREYFFANWFIDGTGNSLQKDVLMEVVDGVITAIDSDISPSSMPDGWNNYSYCTILPPFVDSHVHLAFSSSVDSQVRKVQINHDYQQAANQIHQNLNYHYKHGIRAIRDGGDSHGHVAHYAQNGSSEKRYGIKLTTVGWGYYKHGKYGKGLGRPLLDEDFLNDKVFFAENANWAKFFLTGANNLTSIVSTPPLQFSSEQLEYLQQMVQREGVRLMVHANGKLAAEKAIELGCDSLEHGYFIDENTLEQLAQKENYLGADIIRNEGLYRKYQVRFDGRIS